VLARLRQHLDAIRAHDPGTRLGKDPEELHLMRVAVRRLRAILRVARPMLQAEAVDALRAELAWLSDALGARRDLDVMRARLIGELIDFEPVERRAGRRLLRRLDEGRKAAGLELLKALGDDRYRALLGCIESLILHPPVTAQDVSLDELAAREFKKLRKSVKGLPETPSDADLHFVRIKAKRARYASELAMPVAGGPAERFAVKAKRLQDILGDHQDAVVAEEYLRGRVGDLRGRRASFVAGRLAERQRARRLAARAEFARYWPKVVRRGRQAWT
jgi:CHAD domain-containing protein